MTCWAADGSNKSTISSECSAIQVPAVSFLLPFFCTASSLPSSRSDSWSARISSILKKGNYNMRKRVRTTSVINPLDGTIFLLYCMCIPSINLVIYCLLFYCFLFLFILLINLLFFFIFFIIFYYFYIFFFCIFIIFFTIYFIIVYYFTVFLSFILLF